MKKTLKQKAVMMFLKGERKRAVLMRRNRPGLPVMPKLQGTVQPKRAALMRAQMKTHLMPAMLKALTLLKMEKVR